MSNTERTLSIIKPDAVERNLENEIKEIFKSNGFSILNEKKIKIEKQINNQARPGAVAGQDRPACRKSCLGDARF